MKKQQRIHRAGLFVVPLIAIVVVVVFASVKNESPTSQSAVNALSTSHSPASLETIINSRTTWDVAFPSWNSKPAADFVMKDINDQMHNLSDYQGKNLLVVFWATWCPACKAEIPHLIELRKMYSEDELGIVAISNESPDDLKRFAADNGMNYTVANLGSALPEPFSKVTSIPTTFFISKDGTIKLTALGLVPLEASKAILEAE